MRLIRVATSRLLWTVPLLVILEVDNQILAFTAVPTTTGSSKGAAGGQYPGTMSTRASKDDSVATSPDHVVIAGAGVIGLTTAYYLAKNFQIPCTLVDPSGSVAPAASGKAGGFLALDWNDYSPTGPLTRRSFDLHQQLADDLGAEKLQYRRLTCAAVSVAGSAQQQRPSGKKLEGVEWVQGDSVLGMRPLGTTETIAQVHPKRLCEALLEAAQTMVPSTRVVQGKVVGPVHHENSNEFKGVQLQDGTIIEADALLYACGPWTSNLMTGVKYHSVVVPTDEVLSQCVFFSGAGDPEVYVRPDRTAYLTGFPDAPVRVTEEPGQEEVRSEKIQEIRNAVQNASPEAPWSSSLAKSESSSSTDLESACYLPSTPDGLPIMGALGGDSSSNCFVAAGHSCWGILLGPATGEAMAHLIATGNDSPHVSLQPFRPSRFGEGAMEMVPTAQS